MNRLANETSPYLLLHKDNPVDWRPWGSEAFAEAETQNKPIFLSIGYTACHWCHVMAGESFNDAETAAYLNEHFICIKVDREERPDVDQLYQAAANLMGHTGGWPLNTFLTPERVPFAAGTYFPKEERAGMSVPFKTLLKDIVRLRSEEKERVDSTAENVARELTNLWHRDMRGPITPQFLDAGAIRIAQRFDIFFGGIIGQEPKFPSVALLNVAWRAFLRTGTGQFMQVVSTSLDNMLLGGLHDHIGGGFFRYCVDERWIVPHFEKVLCDSALMLELMTSVWQFNRNKLCETRVAETVRFLLRDLRAGASFASSIDSDSDGEVGRYYLWSEAEIDAALMGTFAAKFKSAYNVTRDGNLNGRNLIQRIGTAAPFPQSDADETLLATQREKLLKARLERPLPRRDDKILADWNGLTIAALANAGTAFNRSDWTNAAIEAFDFVVKAMGDGDRLYHSWLDGKRGAMGFADDYAHMARAALALYEATGDMRYVDHAKRWTHTLNEHFWDAEKGGYYFTADDADRMIVRARMVFDQPVPSANSTMIEVNARLMTILGSQDYADRLNGIVNAFAGEAQRAFISMGSFYSGLEFALLALHILVVGAPNNAKTHELINAVFSRPLPNRILTQLAPGQSLPEGHPLAGKGMENGQPTAYIWVRGNLSAPVTNPVTLSQMLQLPPPRPQPGQRPQ
ncbi:MAG: thioredoxin domain-containing protein [Proteobacteria bacterium]|nr:thioredoxin domain-containing protein [Pseudomonadota bacterium]